MLIKITDNLIMQQTATVLIKMLGATAAEIHSNTFNVHNNIFNKDKFWKPKKVL